jgi:hypothetical protein
MRKEMTAAIVSIGILGGISGSARAQQFDPCPVYQIIGMDGLCHAMINIQNNGGITGNGGFRSAIPPAASASGIWCVVGNPNLPISLRQLPTPLPLGTPCSNPPYTSVDGIVR